MTTTSSPDEHGYPRKAATAARMMVTGPRTLKGERSITSEGE